MNDPRITSYALGELAGQERDDFERELTASEDLQRELNEIIHLVESLDKLPMPNETLTEEARAALRSECTKNLIAVRRKTKIVHFIVTGGVVAAAACLLFSLALPAVTGGQRKGRPLNSPRESGFVTSSAPAATPTLNSLPGESILAELPTMTLAPLESEKMPGSSELSGGAPAASVLSQIATEQAKVHALAGNPSSAPTPASMAPSANASQYAFTTSISSGAAQPAEPMAGSVNAFRGEWARGQDSAEKNERFASGLEAPAAPSTASLSRGAVAGTRGSAAIASSMPVSGTGNRAGYAVGYADGSEQDKNRAPAAGDIPLAARLYRSDERAAVRQSGFNTEAYDVIKENVFLPVKDMPLSTFSIDVDTASYSNVRRFLQSDQVPPAGAIRTEELINYFTYNYPQPDGDAPFSVNLEVSRAPWNSSRELVRIGLKGREIPESERGPANLVFLLDVSGSMNQPAKLPLLTRSLAALVENLAPTDRVAIVVYAGSSGLVLPSTPGKEKSKILESLDDLKAGGSTNGGSGIRLAYKIARENFLTEGNNRVILCTDGDFNVGTTSQSELTRLIENERKSGVFLSVLGFGTGNLKDSTMEKLADKGNGNYAYIDSLSEGRKVLVEQMGSTLFTIAKDVKVQVEFNPARVAGYRLIGYENRLLAKEDFNDDKKDAGEIGSGHTVTALYEIIPAGTALPGRPTVDPLKYQKPEPVAEESPASSELLTVKLRYKAPDGDKSRLITVPLEAAQIPSFEQASPDFQFATAVAAFGMKLRGSPTAGDLSWKDIKKIVRNTLGEDPGSYRAEFLTLIEKASSPKPAWREDEE